jgi:HSP20 family molecular chaperone IbpA
MKKIFLLPFFIFSLITFSNSSFAQNDNRQIEEIMKAREEMIKSLFNDTDFENFDNHFNDLVKKFEQNNFGSTSEDLGDVVGEYNWRETDTHQILSLKVKQIKNKPLDIKIEKGQIKLKGDVESVPENSGKIKRISKVHFERSFSIPSGVDQNNPEFENKGGELLIKFKKLKQTNSTKKSGEVSAPKNADEKEKRPKPLELNPKDTII